VKNADNKQQTSPEEQAFINPFSIASRRKEDDSDENSDGKETAQGFYKNTEDNSNS